MISIVSPVYKAEKIIDELVKECVTSISELSMDFEIILVDDGSPDKSWQKITEICKNNKQVKGIKLSRNFGQHAAIFAGLEYSRGEYVVILDCDLQDDPKYIPELYSKISRGYDLVLTHKKRRKHSLFREFYTSIFYKVFSWLSNYELNPLIGCYSILSRKVVKSLLRINDSQGGYVLALNWLGYKQGFIEVEHRPRYEGRSSYSLRSLFSHAVKRITSYSDKLLHISIYIGMLFFGSSVLGIFYLIYKYFFLGTKEGWTSVMVAILLVGGVIILCLGILGLYIGRIFEFTQNRPRFLVQNQINVEEFSD